MKFLSVPMGNPVITEADLHADLRQARPAPSGKCKRTRNVSLPLSTYPEADATARGLTTGAGTVHILHARHALAARFRERCINCRDYLGFCMRGNDAGAHGVVARGSCSPVLIAIDDARDWASCW